VKAKQSIHAFALSEEVNMKSNRGIRVFTSIALVLLLAVALGSFTPKARARDYGYPSIKQVTPSPAEIGDVITLTSGGGVDGFLDTPGKVTFSNGEGWDTYTEGRLISWNNDQIVVVVPYTAAGSGVFVECADGYECGDSSFYIKLTLDSVFPKNVCLGQTLTLRGGAFNAQDTWSDIHFYSQSRGDFVLRYPDIEFVLKPRTNTEMQIKLYNQAPGDYEIYDQTYAGVEQKSQRLPITIEPPPAIESVSPNPCPAGATLTIKGSGFGDVKSGDFDIKLYEVNTGKTYKDFNIYQWTPGTVKCNTLPNFEGKFKILVTKGVAARLDSRMIMQGSNEVEITFTKDPIPAQDVVGETSRSWGHDSIGVTSHAKEWYLPEASTANGDESWVLVQNPNSTRANVTLTYITSTEVKEMPSDTIEPNSRKTYNVAEALPETAGISVKAKSDIPVAAEKAVYGNHRAWAHESIGVSQAATQWYLAEGCTAPGFSARISVMNPTDSDANVSLTYMTPTGPKAGPSEVLRANSRTSYDVSATVPDEWSVSTEVKSNVPVVAERAMFGNNSTWAHDSIGVTGASTLWYLAEGCTAPNFETWVLVQNPGDQTANVSLTYMTPSGALAGPTESVAPKSRKTFEVAKNVPDAWEVSTRITSDQPVVVERSLYGNNRTWATDSIGVTTPSSTWYLPEGCTLPWLETWVLLQNPNDKETQFKITYNTANGAVAGPAETLPPNSRMTYNPAHTVNNSADVSAMIESDNPIVVERAMYGDQR
jgi:hypothetical protein